MELSVPALLALVRDGGALGLLILWLVAGFKEVWVWGTVYRRALADAERERGEKDKWQDLAWREAHLADRLERRR